MSGRVGLRAAVPRVVPLGLWGLLAWAAAPPCQAQILAQVLPVREIVTAHPWVPVARQVVVTNRGDVPVVVRPRLADLAIDERGEMSLLPSGSLTASLAGCLRFEPDVFSLPPGESGRVELTLELPPDGLPTRWGVLLCEVRPATPGRATLGPRAVAELGTTIYLSRIAPERIAPQVLGLSARAGNGQANVFAVRLRNAGERQFHVGGSFELADSSGATVQSGRLPTGVVLPGHERELTWTCDAPLAPGNYRATATLDTGEPELLVAESRMTLPVPLAAPAVASRR